MRRRSDHQLGMKKAIMTNGMSPKRVASMEKRYGSLRVRIQGRHGSPALQMVGGRCQRTGHVYTYSTDFAMSILEFQIKHEGGERYRTTLFRWELRHLSWGEYRGASVAKRLVDGKHHRERVSDQWGRELPGRMGQGCFSSRGLPLSAFLSQGVPSSSSYHGGFPMGIRISASVVGTDYD